MSHQFDSGLFVNANLGKEWHGLGKVIDKAPTTTLEAMQLAGMDWEVNETPVTTIGANDEPEVIDGWKCLRRSDNHQTLNVCRESWTPVQNKDAFSWFDPIIADGDAEISAAVSLQGGKRIAITAKIKGQVDEVVSEDPVEAFLLLYNSHDGTLCLGVKFTNIRVVCANTLNANLKGERKQLLGEMDWQTKGARIRHTSNIHANLDAVRDAIDIQKRTFRYTLEEYRAMAQVDLSMAKFNDYIAKVFASDLKGDRGELRPATSLRNYEQLVKNFESGAGADLRGVRGTLWGAYNAITEWTSHQRGHGDDIEAARKRLNNLWFGSAEKINQTAHDAALSFI